MCSREKTCFFSGHRILPKSKISAINEILYDEIRNMYDRGVRDFISGGAVGFDMMAAFTVINLKKKFPDIKLRLYIPCYNYGENWKYDIRCKLHEIKCNADFYDTVTKAQYFPECMKIRNKKMVDDSICGIAYKVIDRSGTGQTLAIAKRQGVEVINIADILANQNK